MDLWLNVADKSLTRLSEVLPTKIDEGANNNDGPDQFSNCTDCFPVQSKLLQRVR